MKLALGRMVARLGNSNLVLPVDLSTISASLALVSTLYLELVTKMKTDSLLMQLTATLIQGPNDIQVIYNGAGLDLNENCAINGNLADCTVVAAVDGTTSTDFVTETVAPFEIQGGPALTSGGSVPSVTSSPTSGVPSGTSASGGSQAGSTPSGGASQTSAPPAGNTAPGDNSGAVKMGMSYLVWVASGVALLVLG